jgi:hypothetical protein
MEFWLAPGARMIEVNLTKTADRERFGEDPIHRGGMVQRQIDHRDVQRAGL